MTAGLRATWRAPWMVVVFFAANLVLAAAVAAPMHLAISDHVGRSFMGEDLARGFRAAWLTEFQIAYEQFLQGFSVAIVYGGLLFLALNTVLAGGAFEVFAAGEGARMQAFGCGVGKYFARFARLALIGSVLYFLAFLIWQDQAAKLLDRLFRGSVTEFWHFYLNWARAALLFLSVILINVTLEYARADIVTRDRGSALAALGQASGFVLRHLPQVLAIYFGIGMLTLLAILLYSVFARFFPQSSVVSVLLWFVVAQVLLWARWLFRLASWGAAVAFYGRPKVQA